MLICLPLWFLDDENRVSLSVSRYRIEKYKFSLKAICSCSLCFWKQSSTFEGTVLVDDLYFGAFLPLQNHTQSIRILFDCSALSHCEYWSSRKKMPSITLGFAEAASSWTLVSHLFPDKIGGRPAWLALKHLPKSSDLICPCCQQPMSFLLQVSVLIVFIN